MYRVSQGAKAPRGREGGQAGGAKLSWRREGVGCRRSCSYWHSQSILDLSFRHQILFSDLIFLIYLYFYLFV